MPKDHPHDWPDDDHPHPYTPPGEEPPAHKRYDMTRATACARFKQRRRVCAIFDDIATELERAEAKHGPRLFASAHEGMSVLREEVDELWDEVKRDASAEAMRKEAIQIAAMAVKFILSGKGDHR